MVPPLESTLLAGVPHAFSARDGLTGHLVLSAGKAVRVRQVHSTVVVNAQDAAHTTVEADAIVTDRAGLVLQIVTADCAPVLLSDAEAGVIGAAHAGWRGAVGGILANTVAAMERLGARPGRMVAAIGPTIAQESYEVDALFRDAFAQDAARYFTTGRAGHLQFDLPGYCAYRLRQARVTRIDDLTQNTYSQPARFHSYRRATHAGEPTGGRQTSAIALPHG